VSVTSTDPPGEATLKRTDAACRTPATGAGTVPGSVSTLSVGAVVDVDVFELPPHPAQKPTVNVNARARDLFTRFIVSSEKVQVSAIHVPLQYRLKNRERVDRKKSVSHAGFKRYRLEMTHKKIGTAPLLLDRARINENEL
jgi:hypothetical protein